jgi:hypothetical protein
MRVVQTNQSDFYLWLRFITCKNSHDAWLRLQKVVKLKVLILRILFCNFLAAGINVFATYFIL